MAIALLRLMAFIDHMLDATIREAGESSSEDFLLVAFDIDLEDANRLLREQRIQSSTLDFGGTIVC